MVKGDATIASIAAASIVAKVVRDRMMQRLGTLYPSYGFATNAGYSTAEHLGPEGRSMPLPSEEFSPLRQGRLDV